MQSSRESNGNSVTRRTGPRVPFDATTWRRAKKLAAEYRIVLESDGHGGYVGSSIEFPSVLAEGRSPGECVESTRRALALGVGTMLKAGRRPPAPARRRVRQTQVNVRLTSDERFALAEAARRLGFKGISDFVRTAALQRIAAA